MTFEADMLGQRGVLMGTALRMTRHREDAEDLVQETLAKALRYKGSFSTLPNVDIGPWLRTIMRNTFLTNKRRCSTKNEVLHDDPDPDLSSAMVACPPSQEFGIDLSRVVRAISEMPPMYRDALVSAGEGASYEDLVEETGMSLSSVKKHRHRGRMYLEQALGGMSFESDGFAMAAIQGQSERAPV